MHNQDQPLIFELSTPGRIGYSLPEMDVPEVDLSSFFLKDILREEEPELPEVSELDIMRHYTALIQKKSWCGFRILPTRFLYDEI